MTAQLVGLLQPDEQKAIAAFQERLQTQYSKRVFQVVLFGSKSRGDSRPESDIDILLVVDESNWRFRHVVSDMAADVSLEYGVLIGPRVMSYARWQRMQRECFSFYENVAREGIPLTSGAPL